MLQMTTILVSRPHWADRLIEVWMRLDEEDVENAERTFSGPMVRYRRLEKLDPKHLKQILESRGVIRIVILRLMATVTYFAEPCGVTNTHIESFLHLAYVGSHNLRVRLDDCHTREETMTALEHGVELLQFSSAISGSASGQDVPYAVAPAFTMAPTTLVGLLVVLAQRKTLNGVQTLRKAPSGLSPSTSLDHIQQITHPDIIRRIIKISHQRLHARMIAGNYRAKEPSDTKDTLTACVVFVSIAELAAALVALDMHTEGRYASDIRPARKVLVLSLGGASRMAFGVGNYLQALHFGRGAVKAAEGIPDEEGLDLGAIRSIKLLIDQANVEIYESA
ncbi:hypothetical protein CONPUDRAFT_170189 [Coniophora puteana RWD-64-598 SS2]|uniref:Uncharacterized protein n=1 Tax=Coniophora puteana (strain RWD-64-598) TaxID=741705 RepID=R7SE95_CONPW|nr:uncharacterized protein CONPUDRAFT_170189 [Coniophora puteana RWD-64-598 SS2]EIW74501.1 hypothetical protein CONPUDRAFT_170189 [Coniophora puteana RWD-64-598 SS2]